MSGTARRSRALAAVTLMLASGGAWSASDDECAGWLCVFVGFALPECQGPRKAMMKRIFELRSPLPTFGSCSADGNSNGYDVRMTSVARIGNSSPPRYVAGTCAYDDDNKVEGDWIPVGCTGTYRAIAVTQHGVRVGDIFYVQRKKSSRGGGTNNFDDKD